MWAKKLISKYGGGILCTLFVEHSALWQRKESFTAPLALPVAPPTQHSLEMHLPYIHHVMGDTEFTLVPILVGSTTAKQQELYGKLLAPYLEDPGNFFVISSDFCHWGQRFRCVWFLRIYFQLFRWMSGVCRGVCRGVWWKGGVVEGCGLGVEACSRGGVPCYTRMNGCLTKWQAGKDAIRVYRMFGYFSWSTCLCIVLVTPQ